MTFIASVTKQRFLASDEAAWAREELEHMVTDIRYNTSSSPSYVHGQAEGVSFADQHLRYLSEHPLLSVQDYLSNLRLKTRKR